MSDEGREPVYTDTEAEQPPTRGWPAWLPIMTFIFGAVLGALVLAAIRYGADSGTEDTAVVPPGVSSPAATSAASPGVNTAVQPCLDAADLATRALDEVEAGATAAGQLDAQALRDALNRVQELQPQVREQADKCRQDVAGQAP